MSGCHTSIVTLERLCPLRWLAAAVALTMVLQTGCGGGGHELMSISISPPTASLTHVGQTIQFTAAGTFDKVPGTPDITKSVSWSSSTPSVATVDNTGLATVAGCGTTTIRAQSAGINGEATLTSSCTAPASQALVSITVDPATPTIAQIGQTTQFVAIGNYGQSTADLTPTATWSSSNTQVATVDSGGLATAVGCGTTTIRAQSAGILGETLLTSSCAVPPNQALVSITVDPATPTIAQIGQTTQFIAIGSYGQGTSPTDFTQKAIWSSSNAQVAIVDNGGLATAVGCGTTTIRAQYAVNNTVVTGETLLTSTCATPPSQALVSITLDPATPTIGQIGQTTQFIAIGNYGQGTIDLTHTAMWSSSNVQVATIDNGGFATAVGCGTTTIRAQYTAVNGVVTGEMLLNSACTTPPNQGLISITVDPVNPTIGQIAQTTQFIAIGNFTQNSSDITHTVTWSSSNKQVATIDPNGLAAAVSCGTTTITAESQNVITPTLLTVSCDNLPRVELLITKTGTTAALVTSSPVGINCGTTCAALFVEGTAVVLTASPPPSSWLGCDQVIGNACSLTIRQINGQPNKVTANFP